MPLDGNPEEFEAQISERPFTPDHFEKWLASMPRNQEYNWYRRCLYQQYGEHCGVTPVYSAYNTAVRRLKENDGRGIRAGEPFRFVASIRPHTFGAALRRLRVQRYGRLRTALIYFQEWRSSP